MNSPSSRKGRFSDRRGFVLVTVLLIIALVTVLVVVTSMLSQIERRAIQNGVKIETARQNALFGLGVAMAQLQKEAGPDQRVSARAEILDANPATAVVEEVSEPYWTGIWKSTQPGAPDQQLDTGSNLRSWSYNTARPQWLVSAPLNTVLDPKAGVPAALKSVPLAKNLPDPAKPADLTAKVAVKVPLVPMQIDVNPGVTGNYAYWVSDEGVKAKANLLDPTLAKDPVASRAENQLHFLAPQATEVRKGLLGPKITADLRGDSAIIKTGTLQSLGMLTGVDGLFGTDAARYFPQATTCSFGVLADVRNGGLKKDLTAAFEDPTTFNSFATKYGATKTGTGDAMLYRSATAAGMCVPPVDTGITPPTDGLPWASLFFFYNSYKSLMPYDPIPAGSGSSTPVRPKGVSDPSSLPYSLSPRVYGMKLDGQNTKLSGIMPTVVAYRVDCAISSYQSGGKWKLRVHYYPQLVLHNPYSVRLDVTNFQMRREFNAFTVGVSPCKVNIRVGATTIDPFSINQAGNGGRLQLWTRIGEALPLEPGESRVFALDADADFGTNISTAINFQDLRSDPAMSPDYSQFVDVPPGTVPPGTPAGFNGTANGDDIVTVSLSSSALNANAVDTFVAPNGLKWPNTDGSSRYTNGAPDSASASASFWTPRAISAMTAPTRLIGVYIRMKGLRPSSSLGSNGAERYSYAQTALPLFMGNGSLLNLFDDARSAQFQEVYLSSLGNPYQNGQTDVQIAPSGSHWETSFGDESAGAAAPGSRRIFRDVPGQTAGFTRTVHAYVSIQFLGRENLLPDVRDGLDVCWWIPAGTCDSYWSDFARLHRFHEFPR